MTEPTNAELEAQIASIRRVLEERELVPLVAINAILADAQFAGMVEAINDALPLLSGQRLQQATNIVSVVGQASQYLAREAAEITERLTATAPADPEPTPPE